LTRGFSRLLNLFKPQKKEHTSTEIPTSFPAETLNSLEKIIGSPIGDKSFYIEALIHRSFLEENEQFYFSNERLEFLGDSVLNLIIGEYLFDRFPDEAEGFLTKVRAKLVNRNALSNVAEQLMLGELLVLSSTVPKSVAHNSKSMLSDALEALIGALYLDKGLEACQKFIKKNILEPSLKSGEHLVDENYKSQLLENAQANKLDIPVYQITSEEGPHHDKTFTAEVIIEGKVLGEGKGKSKKEAEQNAAKAALKIIKTQQDLFE
jgi:ribonuclease-3